MHVNLDYLPLSFQGGIYYRQHTHGWLQALLGSLFGIKSASVCVCDVWLLTCFQSVDEAQTGDQEQIWTKNPHQTLSVWAHRKFDVLVYTYSHFLHRLSWKPGEKKQFWRQWEGWRWEMEEEQETWGQTGLRAWKKDESEMAGARDEELWGCRRAREKKWWSRSSSGLEGLSEDGGIKIKEWK